MTFRDLLPSYSERSAIIGTTGSGKTTLGKYIVTQYPRFIVYDAKDDYYLSNVKRFRTFKEVYLCEEDKIIYAPTFEEINERYINAFFRYVYERGDICVHITEVYAVVEDGFPSYYKAILTRGRSRNVVCISESQRPYMIPQTIISESENIYTFRLNLPQDRNVVERITGIPEKQIATLKKQHFYYTKQSYGNFGPFRLNIKE